MFDANDGAPQRSDEIIPNGTFARVRMTFLHGNTNGTYPGDEGLLHAYSGGSVALSAEFTVLDGLYRARKFWSKFFVVGKEGDASKTGPIVKSIVKAILDSAFGMDPSDRSEAAAIRRRIPNFSALNGIEFFAKIGVEESAGYADKNNFSRAVTVDQPEYQILMRGETPEAKPGRVSGSRAAPAQSGAQWQRPASQQPNGWQQPAPQPSTYQPQPAYQPQQQPNGAPAQLPLHGGATPAGVAQTGTPPSWING